jgi:hypothetical protein
MKNKRTTEQTNEEQTNRELRSISKLTVNQGKMTRIEFFKKLIRFGLLVILSLIVFALGSRVVTGKDCSACPGKGICKGETDCNKY